MSSRSPLPPLLTTLPCPSPQSWRAPATSNSLMSERPQPWSPGRPHPPGWTASKCPTSWRMEVTPLCLCPCQLPLLPLACPPAALGSPHGQPPALTVLAGEPQSVQVDGRAQAHQLQGLQSGTRYEVTVVSVRGFEESEPLTGFLTTGKMGQKAGGGGEGRWRLCTGRGEGRAGIPPELLASSSARWPHSAARPEPDGRICLAALDASAGPSGQIQCPGHSSRG